MRHSLVPLFAIALLASPLAAQAPAITCKDGSSSTASGRGACSGHGGVDKAATARAEKSAKVERKAESKSEKSAQKTVKAEQKAEVREAAKTGTKVTCSDGTMSDPGRGACGHHGGVRVAAATLPATVPANAPARTRSRAESRAPSAASAISSNRAEDHDPTGAIAQCKDGMYSHASNRRGACSRHNGVAKWMP